MGVTSAAATREWRCCHLGAREHYAVPRGLHRAGRLSGLIADAWVRPGSIAERLPGDTARRIRERYHPELATVPVTAFTLSLLAHEFEWRARGLTDWHLAIERNRWFQRRAAAAVARAAQPAGVVFAHSYAALQIFRAAKRRGSITVLGQIDPGPEYFSLVRQLAEQRPDYGTAPAVPPRAYFEDWREECLLADHIVVNSEWSRQSLERAGVPRAKLSVVPLPYDPEVARTHPHEYPPQFSPARPLRALFVGTASVSKGVPELLDAMRLVKGLPIQLELVGGTTLRVPDALRGDASLKWTGAVARSEVMERYRKSDLLVFPSHSDGFGMAQVEARAWGLPIVASRHCGDVVIDGQTGWLLPEVSAPAIAQALREAVHAPHVLRQYAAATVAAPVFTVDDFGRALTAMVS